MMWFVMTMCGTPSTSALCSCSADATSRIFELFCALACRIAQQHASENHKAAMRRGTGTARHEVFMTGAGELCEYVTGVAEKSWERIIAVGKATATAAALNVFMNVRASGKAQEMNSDRSCGRHGRRRADNHLIRSKFNHKASCWGAWCEQSPAGVGGRMPWRPPCLQPGMDDSRIRLPLQPTTEIALEQVPVVICPLLAVLVRV